MSLIYISFHNLLVDTEFKIKINKETYYYRIIEILDEKKKKKVKVFNFNKKAIEILDIYHDNISKNAYIYISQKVHLLESLEPNEETNGRTDIERHNGKFLTYNWKGHRVTDFTDQSPKSKSISERNIIKISTKKYRLPKISEDKIYIPEETYINRTPVVDSSIQRGRKKKKEHLYQEPEPGCCNVSGGKIKSKRAKTRRTRTKKYFF